MHTPALGWVPRRGGTPGAYLPAVPPCPPRHASGAGLPGVQGSFTPAWAGPLSPAVTAPQPAWALGSLSTTPHDPSRQAVIGEVRDPSSRAQGTWVWGPWQWGGNFHSVLPERQGLCLPQSPACFSLSPLEATHTELTRKCCFCQRHRCPSGVHTPAPSRSPGLSPVTGSQGGVVWVTLGTRWDPGLADHAPTWGGGCSVSLWSRGAGTSASWEREWGSGGTRAYRTGPCDCSGGAGTRAQGPAQPALPVLRPTPTVIVGCSLPPPPRCSGQGNRRVGCSASPGPMGHFGHMPSDWWVLPGNQVSTGPCVEGTRRPAPHSLAAAPGPHSAPGTAPAHPAHAPQSPQGADATFCKHAQHLFSKDSAQGSPLACPHPPQGPTLGRAPQILGFQGWVP